MIDDGDGIIADAHPGVGIASMQERAAELGGTCTVGRGEHGGTEVHAFLPIAELPIAARPIAARPIPALRTV